MRITITGTDSVGSAESSVSRYIDTAHFATQEDFEREALEEVRILQQLVEDSLLPHRPSSDSAPD